MLLPLFLILLTIFIWCFYFRFIRAFLSRRKLQNVEVMPYNSKEAILSRKEAKSNLKLVIETTTGLKLENSRFDRYWFDERRERLSVGENSIPQLITQEQVLNSFCKGFSHRMFATLINNHYES